MKIQYIVEQNVSKDCRSSVESKRLLRSFEEKVKLLIFLQFSVLHSAGNGLWQASWLPKRRWRTVLSWFLQIRHNVRSKQNYGELFWNLNFFSAVLEKSCSDHSASGTRNVSPKTLHQPLKNSKICAKNWASKKERQQKQSAESRTWMN